MSIFSSTGIEKYMLDKNFYAIWFYCYLSFLNMSSFVEIPWKELSEENIQEILKSGL